MESFLESAPSELMLKVLTTCGLSAVDLAKLSLTCTYFRRPASIPPNEELSLIETAALQLCQEKRPYGFHNREGVNRRRRELGGSWTRLLSVVSSGTVSGCVATLEGHTNGVKCLAVAPDGTLFSGSMDCTIRQWQGGRCVATMSEHAGGVLCLVLAPDGTLYSGSGDQTIRKWQDGRSIATLSGHSGWVKCLAMAPDGMLYSGSSDMTIRQWRGDQCVAVLQGHRDVVWCLAVASHGTLYSGSMDRTIRHWRGGSCIATLKLQSPSDGPETLASAPDGTWYSGCANWLNQIGSIRQYQGEHCISIKHSNSEVICLALASDGAFYSGLCDGTIQAWREGCCVATLSGHDAKVACLALAPDGTLYSGSTDNTVREWH